MSSKRIVNATAAAILFLAGLAPGAAATASGLSRRDWSSTVDDGWRTTYLASAVTSAEGCPRPTALNARMT
jgi:spermidine/putrescine-binding protein